MEKIVIKDEGLTHYYLEQEFQDIKESGLKFKYNQKTEESTVTLNYNDMGDLEKKINIILQHLTDK